MFARRVESIGVVHAVILEQVNSKNDSEEANFWNSLQTSISKLITTTACLSLIFALL